MSGNAAPTGGAFRIYFFIIFAVSLIVFFPSFSHTFRADQIVYFANTRGYDSLPELWTRFYAYERVRYYEPGDAILFRPMIAMLLGAEKAAFGVHYQAWHLVGFGLHILTVYFLFRILYGLGGGVPAFLCALTFAVGFAPVEAVIWEHINGYVLFTALVMGAFCCFKRFYDADGGARHLSAALVCLCVAVFLNELGSIYAILFGMACFFKNRAEGRDLRLAWLFVIPVVCYAAAYAGVNGLSGDVAMQHDRDSQLLRILSSASIVHVAVFFCQYLGHLIVHGLFPMGFQAGLNNMDRLVFYPKVVSLAGFALNGAAVAGIFIFGLKRSFRRVPEGHGIFIALAASMALCPVLILPLVRLSTHGAAYVLEIASYYGYIFWANVLVAVFLAGCGRPGSEGGALSRRAMAACLGVLALLTMYQTFSLNLSLKEKRAPWRQYIDSANAFIAAHGHEPGFSFYVRNDQPVILSHYLPGGRQRGMECLDLASVLYYRYYNPRTPRYILSLSRTGLLSAESREGSN